MLSTNVLCIKKRKKRSYCIANRSEYAPSPTEKGKRSNGAVTMLQITEDTPPDMLAGAMDLTVHLPTSRSVKMSVERSTPMMDLLVQITTNHHLQLSGYTLQVLGMAPSTEHSDRILPYKPNTPIGALDTQHIRVIPKARTIPVPKNIPPGHQPFESTFRLKVYLPRNQLFVTRVSQSVHLEEIMKKVCGEKNLDPVKYEFRHPGNLDEILDPKLTLSDYQITEIYVVLKGTRGLNQVFSSSDIMALRKEEERKQMHNKTGGGVFNLIFRRGKSSSGSGSLSSENRSISPTHSDDSRSVTPPGVQQQIIVAPPQPEQPVDKPKPPQRKRRPAPKPPQVNKKELQESDVKKVDTGLTICHSRNSSDSSGYHEASILSDNCNTSLPRRPKSTILQDDTQQMSGQHSQSTSNLSKMSSHSKSTSSLALPSRKKKSAPPPPPVLLKSTSSTTNLDQPSPVVASQPPILNQQESPGNGQDTVIISTNPAPVPRTRTPIPLPRSSISSIHKESNNNENDYSETINPIIEKRNEELTMAPLDIQENDESVIDLNDKMPLNEEILNDIDLESEIQTIEEVKQEIQPALNGNDENVDSEISIDNKEEHKDTCSIIDSNMEEEKTIEDLEENIKLKQSKLHQLQKMNFDEIFSSESFTTPHEDKAKPPEIVALYPKVTKKDRYSKSMFDSYTRKRGFQIGSSLLDQTSDDESTHSSSNSTYKKNSTDLSSMNSVASALNAFNFVDEIEDVDVELFTGSISKNSKRKDVILGQLHGIHALDSLPKNSSVNSLRSVSSVPGFMGSSNMKKWNNIEELDDISLHSNSGRHVWVIGDTSDTESIASTTNPAIDLVTSFQQSPSPTEIKQQIDPVIAKVENEKSMKEIDKSEKSSEIPLQKSEKVAIEVVEIPKSDSKPLEETDLEWQYQLPSPPTAFRDASPVTFPDATQEESATEIADSVVTSPELFEKLNEVKQNQSEKETVSDIISVVSEEEKPILNKLSLEHLEKRKSLVYNRELATSLKMSQEDPKVETFSSSLTKFEKTYEEVRRSSPIKERKSLTSTLPNFKITTYDNPKQKLNIFEDDTIRSNTADQGSKRNSIVETRRASEDSNLQKNYVGRSMENISSRKNSLGTQSDEEFKKPGDYKFYRPLSKPQYSSVFRSESFSTDQNWTPSKPVTRSKSQIALNKYRDNKNLVHSEEENLSKSNSLFDVSGLQSLGVMRLIQNKLNTPSNSMEELDKEEKLHHEQPEVKSEVQNEEKPARTYQYRVPSINMGTWLERPKIPVNVKDDPDYKYSVKDNLNHSKLIVKTTNNDIKSHNSFELRNKPATPSMVNSNSVNLRVNSDNNRNVSIKVNGSETISTQNSGNVVIKIGEPGARPQFRKPLGNINKIDNYSQRPHSIAFGSDFDISRVPIVRSVEFKKPYKDFQNHNTSITQIYQNNNPNFNGSLHRNTFNSMESLDKEKHPPTVTPKPQVEPKPAFRVNSYMQNTAAPTVRGFRNITNNNNNVTLWSQPHSFSTLPNKPRDFSTNKSVPFSQMNLRRTESTKIPETNNKNAVNPPPPPMLPKVLSSPPVKPVENYTGDPKEQLLQAIRDFGGKKGLRAVKV